MRTKGPVPAKAREQAAHVIAELSRDDLLRMYFQMVLSRTLEERMWALNRMGKAPFVISPRGQEAAQVGAAFAFQPGLDVFRPYYRDMAFVLTIGMTPRDLMLDFLARGESPSSGGRQMSAHPSSPRLKIVTPSSVIGPNMPQAAGLALAAKIRGEKAVVYCSFGEGATSEGDWHEGLNFAGVHELPVVFYCQNNCYAISTPPRKQMAVPNVADRAAAYGIPGEVVDGQDVVAVYRAMKTAVERARHGDGPTLIEAKTYRFLPHSSDDDDRTYRPREEVDAWEQRDPIDRFKHYLQEHSLLAEADDRAIRERAGREADDATEYAEQAPLPSADTLADNVYAA